MKKNNNLDLNLELFDWHKFANMTIRANKEIEECGSKEVFNLLTDILSEKEKEALSDFANFMFEHLGRMELVHINASTEEEAIEKLNEHIRKQKLKDDMEKEGRN